MNLSEWQVFTQLHSYPTHLLTLFFEPAESYPLPIPVFNLYERTNNYYSKFYLLI